MRTYLLLMGTAVRAELQYRGNLLIMMVGGIAYQCTGLAFIWTILGRFGNIGGWHLGEITLLYGVRLMAHGLWVVPGSQLINVDEVVVSGEYDRYLVRPAATLPQLLGRRLSLPSLGDLAGGIVLLTIAAVNAPVDWSPGAIMFLALSVIGGAMIEGAMQLAISGLVFRLLSTREIKVATDNVFNDFGSYPLKIFGPAARFGFTFVLPLAFAAYFPATILLNRSSELAIPVWLASASLAVGLLLLLVAYAFWVRQTRYYTSSGH